MRVVVKIHGLSALRTKLDSVSAAVEEAARHAVYGTGLNIETIAKKSINESPRDGATGRSKPGNPPLTETGILAKSIGTNLLESSRGPYVTVGTNLKYGKWLEFGTTHIVRRPWLNPAFEQTKAKNIEYIKKSIFKAVQSAAKRGAG